MDLSQLINKLSYKHLVNSKFIPDFDKYMSILPQKINLQTAILACRSLLESLKPFFVNKTFVINNTDIIIPYSTDEWLLIEEEDAEISHKSYLQIYTLYCFLYRSKIGVLLKKCGLLVWFHIDWYEGSARRFRERIFREVEWLNDDKNVIRGDLVTPTLNDVAQLFVPDISYISRIPCFEGNVFIHSPYTINLCRECSEIRLIKLLIRSSELKAKGVVVHVGKHKDLSIEDGIIAMSRSIKRALDKASESCPLILETPAGQGTELLCDLGDMLSYYERFETHSNFKICIDTCHVFSSGYDPVFYIKTWLDKYPKAIALVHFNDSKHERGRCVDEHYIPGYGHIGKERMQKVYDLCHEHNIPMVVE
jgi:hypothetical protein